MSYFRRMAMAMPIPSPIDGYVKDGLVLAYDGYQEPSGGVWKDLSGGGNDLILADGVAYDADAHKVTFAATKSITTSEVLVDAATGWTVEIVGGFSSKNQSWFQGDSPWPYTPHIFLGAGLYIQLQNDTQYAYASTGGWFMSRDSIDGEMQFAIAGTESEINGLNNNEEEWDRRPSVAQTKTFVPLNYKLTFATAFIRSLRMYSRKLTAAELLQNRLLDAQRFNLSTTNIQA